MSNTHTKYISCFIMGGLGNQLFQIFTTIATALNHDKMFIFAYDDISPSSVKRYTFWNSFLNNLIQYTNKNNNISSDIIKRFPVYRETHHTFSEIPDNNTHMNLFGYFQSYKYFEKHINYINNLIKLDEQRNSIVSRYPNYFINNTNKCFSTISIHFRVGDYKNIQDCHPIMTLNYYINSIRNVFSRDLTINNNIIFFYEKNDKDYVYEHFINHIKAYPYTSHKINFIDIDFNIDDWKQMLLMSNCNHNIIANSSFSWWGAYFNNNPYKVVCYPDKWFGPKLSDKNVSDMFPYNWNKIKS
jgi:hypothetical protein